MRQNKITFINRPTIKPKEERPYANTLICRVSLLLDIALPSGETKN